MRAFGFILCLWFALICQGAAAGTYGLTDGSSVSGEPINYDPTGVMLRTGTDTYSDRIPWGKFTDRPCANCATTPEIPSTRPSSPP